tara:strand:+ start:5089 stop:5943 length:855 start_codon:yes stop_codon:yes gene_type:complete
MIQKKSIVYVAFGELYVAMAFLSIKSLRKFDQKTKIIIITNLNIDPSVFKFWNTNKDKVLYFPDSAINNREYKININKYVDSEKVAFFDCDTMFLKDINIAWEYLDYFDISLKLNPRRQKKLGKGDIKILNDKYKVRDLPHFNSGVIFFKKNIVSSEFFDKWCISFKNKGINYDQVSLVEALFDSRVRILPLTTEWNYFPNSQYYLGKVKTPIILHYTNRISYVIEDELLKIANLMKFNKLIIKKKIKEKRAERKLKIGRTGWLKLKLIWYIFYNYEKKRHHLT